MSLESRNSVNIEFDLRGNLEDYARELSRRLAQVEEEDIRNGLVSLGWLSPEAVQDVKRILNDVLTNLLSLGMDVPDAVSDARLDVSTLISMHLADEAKR